MLPFLQENLQKFTMSKLFPLYGQKEARYYANQ